MKISALLVLIAVGLSPFSALATSATAHQCRASVQGKIDRIDSEMHVGNKPNEAGKLIERRDRLRAQYKQCEKNPNAYKKSL
ncbi:MAG: hypothetical protein ABI616_10540 [Pseudomonadota bacterium]